MCSPFLFHPGSLSTALRWRALARQLPSAHRLCRAHHRVPLPPESTPPSPPIPPPPRRLPAPVALHPLSGPRLAGIVAPASPRGLPAASPTRRRRGTARPPRVGRADGTAPWGGGGCRPRPTDSLFAGRQPRGVEGRQQSTGGGWRGRGRRAATATAAGLAALVPACCRPPGSRACCVPARRPPLVAAPPLRVFGRAPPRCCCLLAVTCCAPPAAAACPPSRPCRPAVTGHLVFRFLARLLRLQRPSLRSCCHTPALASPPPNAAAVPAAPALPAATAAAGAAVPPAVVPVWRAGAGVVGACTEAKVVTGRGGGVRGGWVLARSNKVQRR